MTPPLAVPTAALPSRLFPALSLVVTALVLVGLILHVGAPSAGSGAAGGTAILRFGSEYNAGSGYDRYSYVIVGHDNAAAAGTLPTTSLVYMSGTSVQTSWSTGVTYDEALANNWLLKDANGQYVRNVLYGAFVGDIGNSGYQQRFVDNVADYLSQHGNEGVFIDDVLISPATMTSGVFPSKYPTNGAWENAMVSFVEAVGPALRARGFYVALNAAAFISGNAASDDGTLTAGFWRRLAPHVNGLMSEYWEQQPPDPSQLRPSGSASWAHHWDGWLNLVDVAQSSGADFFGLMEGSTSDVNHMRYGKASFLLAWDGSGGGFLYHPQGDPWNLEWTMDIGQPSAARYQVGVGWRREYSGGTVLVNPSPSSSQSFSLGGTYTRADGTPVSSVTLGPVSGLVLKSTVSSPPPPPPPPPPPAAPTNTALPVVTGTPQQSATLTTSTGSWSNSPTAYAYQWKRCDTAGSNCSSVGGSATQYALGSADVGKTLRVTVTASNGGGSASATSNATAVITSPTVPPPAPAAPANTALPGTNGTPQQGSTLTASAGSWSNSPTGFAYQWKRCDSAGANCASVAGASAAQYGLASADVGKRLRVTVTASNTGGSGSATSNATSVIASSPTLPPPPPPSTQPTNAALPVISGTPQQGVILAASAGSWSNSPTGYAFQWKRCDPAGDNCASLGGPTGPLHRPGPWAVGMTLRVTVTASNASGSGSATSNATAVVAPAPAPPSLPKVSVRPEISGVPQEGSMLSTSTGTWSNSPTLYGYQWRRCNHGGGGCVSIDGATHPQYMVGPADVGATLRVVVAAWNDAGVTYTRTDQTGIVAPKPALARRAGA